MEKKIDSASGPNFGCCSIIVFLCVVDAEMKVE